MQKMRQTFVCDFDDLSPTTPGFGRLLKIKEHYPNFRCTCFTPAFNHNVFLRKLKVSKFKKWGELVGRESDWLEIAPHGFAHLRGECLETDPKRINIIISAIERIFEEMGIEFVKVFKAPYWEISKEFEEALAERGYTLAIDRNNPVVRTEIPTYVWNWSIDKPIPDYPLIKGHGHVHLTNNGLDKCLPNLLKMPSDANFKTISEYLDGRV